MEKYLAMQGYKQWPRVKLGVKVICKWVEIVGYVIQCNCVFWEVALLEVR